MPQLDGHTVGKRKMILQVEIHVDFETWAANNNGPWPEGPGRALNAAVRHDIRKHVQNLLGENVILVEECDAKVVVR